MLLFNNLFYLVDLFNIKCVYFINSKTISSSLYWKIYNIQYSIVASSMSWNLKLPIWYIHIFIFLIHILNKHFVPLFHLYSWILLYCCVTDFNWIYFNNHTSDFQVCFLFFKYFFLSILFILSKLHWRYISQCF